MLVSAFASPFLGGSVRVKVTNHGSGCEGLMARSPPDFAVCLFFRFFALHFLSFVLGALAHCCLLKKEIHSLRAFPGRLPLLAYKRIQRQSYLWEIRGKIRQCGLTHRHPVAMLAWFNGGAKGDVYWGISYFSYWVGCVGGIGWARAGRGFGAYF